MNTPQTFKTPQGEEMVILPRVEYERPLDAVEEARDIADADAIMARVRGGDEELFPLDLVLRLADPKKSRIKVWREYRGLSQAALAEGAGKSTAYISQMETGRRSGSTKVLRKLAAALGVDLSDIV